MAGIAVQEEEEQTDDQEKALPSGETLDVVESQATADQGSPGFAKTDSEKRSTSEKTVAD